MTLLQDDFEKRGFLELLHFATNRLKKNSEGHSTITPDNIVDLLKEEFTHIFTMKGEEVTNLREIPEEAKVLVCSKNKHFRGVINSSKLVDFHKYKT